MADETIDISKISISRRGSLDVVMPGNEANQTLSIYNGSDYDLSNVMVIETIGNGATFKPRSMQIEGISYVDYNPTNGYPIPGTIKSKSSATVTYKITIDDPLDESLRLISFAASVSFTIENENRRKNSNVYQIRIANGDINITKESNTSAAVKGSILTYQNVIQNSGTQSNTNVVFTDDIPDGTTFVENSVKINNVTQEGIDPSTGINLPNISAGERVTIAFQVVVN